MIIDTNRYDTGVKKVEKQRVNWLAMQEERERKERELKQQQNEQADKLKRRMERDNVVLNKI